MAREDMSSMKVNISGKGGFFVADKTSNNIKVMTKDGDQAVDPYLAEKAKRRAIENDKKFPDQIFSLLRGKI